jgi:membrane-associated protease RseP (regulator of RpoE activity)
VSTDQPSFSEPRPDQSLRVEWGTAAAPPPDAPPPPRPKFQHRYGRHIVLLLLTLVTMSFAQAFLFLWSAIGTDVNPFAAFTWDVFVNGLWYAIPMLAILGAHEFGHYAYCRKHNVDATLPYFLPAPLPFTGTLGAVIRIREAFPSKRALFDIGVAGPIAGFVVLVPFLIAGLMLSSVETKPEQYIYFGEPLLFQGLSRVYFGPIPEGYDIFLHPLGFAAWFGMLATALNLMPFGQLDGGHIAYAVFGRRAAYVSVATLGAAIVLTLRSGSWVAMTVMMLIMAFFLGVRHPRIVDEESPLDAKRKLIAAIALVIFIICFIPVPIELFFRSP